MKKSIEDRISEARLRSTGTWKPGRGREKREEARRTFYGRQGFKLRGVELTPLEEVRLLEKDAAERASVGARMVAVWFRRELRERIKGVSTMEFRLETGLRVARVEELGRRDGVNIRTLLKVLLPMGLGVKMEIVGEEEFWEWYGHERVEVERAMKAHEEVREEKMRRRMERLERMARKAPGVSLHELMVRSRYYKGKGAKT
jgi:hypothetical protein